MIIFFLFVSVFWIQKGFSEFVIAPVESIPVCTTQNRLITPTYGSPIKVSGLAWPINGPQITVPLLANGVAPSHTAVVCMGGCDSPPCLPPTRCDPNDLWWISEYDDLTVPPESPILLPEMEETPPPSLGIFFGNPSPSPTPNPSPSVSPSASSAVTPTFTPVPASCQKDYSAIIVLAVLLTFCVAALAGCLREICILRRQGVCPYCETILPRRAVVAHLRECQKHLVCYSPVTITQVTIVSELQVNQEEGEDQVARPEAVRLQTAFNNA